MEVENKNAVTRTAALDHMKLLTNTILFISSFVAIILSRILKGSSMSSCSTECMLRRVRCYTKTGRGLEIPFLIQRVYSVVKIKRKLKTSLSLLILLTDRKTISETFIVYFSCGSGVAGGPVGPVRELVRRQNCVGKWR